MKQIYNSIKNKEDLDFLLEIKGTLDIDSQREVFLQYKDTYIMLEPHGEEIAVKINGSIAGNFSNFEKMLTEFILDGKPFIERISEIDYE